MNDVEQNIDRLLDLLASTPTLADQFTEYFDETIQALDIEISRDETLVFLNGSTAPPANGHFIQVEGPESPHCHPDDYTNPFTIFITIFTRN